MLYLRSVSFWQGHPCDDSSKFDSYRPTLIASLSNLLDFRQLERICQFTSTGARMTLRFKRLPACAIRSSIHNGSALTTLYSLGATRCRNQSLNQVTPPFGAGSRLVWLVDTTLCQQCSEELLAELKRTDGDSGKLGFITNLQQ